MQVKKVQLNDEERKVLRTLARSGAMSPSRVSAETLILPGEMLKMLRGLADVGVVVVRLRRLSSKGWTPCGQIMKWVTTDHPGTNRPASSCRRGRRAFARSLAMTVHLLQAQDAVSMRNSTLGQFLPICLTPQRSSDAKR